MLSPNVQFGISTPDNPASLQDPAELDGFIDFLVNSQTNSYLEIGCRYGGTFEKVVRRLPEGALAVAVDFPGGMFGDDDSAEHLIKTVRRLCADGYDAHYIFGPSAAPEVQARVQKYNVQFDAIFIDGDHSFAAVKADWDNYSQWGRIVALHDIAAPAGHTNYSGQPVEVPRLWESLKIHRKYCEFVTPGSVMGIGAIVRPARY